MMCLLKPNKIINKYSPLSNNHNTAVKIISKYSVYCKNINIFVSLLTFLNYGESNYT